MSIIEIEAVDAHNQLEVESYLAKHEDTAQFLIGNLKAHGPKQTAHHNSGNFKLIRHNSDVRAVFCLARRGSLIVQSDENFAEIIIQACQAEDVQLTGFIGEWASVEPIYQFFQSLRPDYKPSYESKEILYSYILRDNDPRLVHDPRVRLLEPADFEGWLQHRIAYMTELKVPDGLTTEQKKTDFDRQVREKSWWGMFDEKEILSMTSLNSKSEKVGQVGGVFTPVQHRQKGYSKATMFHLLKDCKNLHGHSKSILFTGETDFPAQKLYESMGYNRVGSFALILG